MTPSEIAHFLYYYIVHFLFIISFFCNSLLRQLFLFIFFSDAINSFFCLSYVFVLYHIFLYHCSGYPIFSSDHPVIDFFWIILLFKRPTRPQWEVTGPGLQKSQRPPGLRLKCGACSVCKGVCKGFSLFSIETSLNISKKWEPNKSLFSLNETIHPFRTSMFLPTNRTWLEPWNFVGRRWGDPLLLPK